MENKNLLNTELVKGSNRAFFMDLKLSENGKNYLVITQSEKKEEGSSERKSIIIFENEIGNFMSAMTRSLIYFSATEGERKSNYHAEQKKQYPNAYKKWSSAEEKLLSEFFEKGATIDELCLTLQRNPKGVEERLKKLGLISILAATA